MEKFKTTILLIIAALCFYISFEANAKTIRVLEVDTGVDVSHPEIFSHIRNGFGFDYTDDEGHGTGIAGLILKDTCKEVELISCRYYYPWSKNYQQEKSNDCFKRALTENIQFVNYSSNGRDPNDEEKEIFRKMSKKGIIVTVAAGNDGLDLTKTGKCIGAYPSCYLFKNMYIVENLMGNGILNPSSNHLKNKNKRAMPGVKIPILLPKGEIGEMTGTSPASAKYMNYLLRKECLKYHK